MSDQRLRQLERRALQGDTEARDQLRTEIERHGVMDPVRVVLRDGRGGEISSSQAWDKIVAVYLMETDNVRSRANDLVRRRHRELWGRWLVDQQATEDAKASAQAYVDRTLKLL